jgi:integrase
MAGNHINDLIAAAGAVLDAGAYPDKTKTHYTGVWERFRGFCLSSGRPEPSREDGAEFLAGWGCPPAGGTGWSQFKRRAVECLFHAAETGRFPARLAPPGAAVPARFAAEHGAWARHLGALGLAPGTVAAKLGAAKQFLTCIDARGVPVVAAITCADAAAYAAGLSQFAASTKTARLYELRGYLRFLVAERGADPSLGRMLPVIAAGEDLALPSAFTRGEVARIVAAVKDPPGRCPRRDRAVVLLAVQLGLRGGDIAALRLDQIDWRSRSLALTQSKTSAPVSLPLPDEAYFALADYLKNERPESADPSVFIRSRAPHGPYSPQNTFYYVVQRCLALAGVEPGGRHHGLHAFRHSLATGMLADATPYPVIAATLGHTTPNATRRYLRIDIDQLRAMSLEVPHAL